MTLEELTAKPGFAELSDDAKVIVMRKTMKGFGDLSEEAQYRVLDQMGRYVTPKPEPTLSEGEQEMVDAPMPAVPTPIMRAAGEEMVEQAPLIAATAATLGMGPEVGIPLRALTAGTAWSATDTVKRAIQDAPVDLMNAGQEFGKGAASEFAGGLVNKVLSPLANKAGQVGEWFQQEGLPRLGNRASKWIEELTGMTISGSALAGKYRKQIQDWAVNERSNILSSVSQNIELPSEIGQKVGKSVVGVFKEPKQLYGDFAKMGGDVGMSDATASIAHKWRAYVDPHDQKLLDLIIEKRNLSTQDISNILGGKQLGIKDMGLRNELKEAMGKDLQAWDVANGTYFKITRDAANEAYKELAKEWATNPRALAILREYDPAFKLKIGGETLIRPNQFLSTRPEKVVEKMFNTGNADELAQLKDVMPKEVWDGATASWIEQLFLSSKAYNPETRQFNPWPWSEAWAKRREVMAKVEPELAARIDKFTEMTTKVKEQLTTEVPSLVQQAKKLALPGAMAFGGIGGQIPLWSIPVMDGFGGLMAWSFLGPSGKGSFAKLVGNTVRMGTGEALLRE